MSQKIKNEPRGSLYSPFCGARNRKGLMCLKQPVNGKSRCRNHGGLSTGPKTDKGKHISSQNSLKTGFYTKDSIKERQLVRDLLNTFTNL